jgi:hypothetical protein
MQNPAGAAEKSSLRGLSNNTWLILMPDCGAGFPACREYGTLKILPTLSVYPGYFLTTPGAEPQNEKVIRCQPTIAAGRIVS